MRATCQTARLIDILEHAGPSTCRYFSASARSLAQPVKHYDALNLPKNATKQQIKARFYELSKKYHPDAASGDTAKFHQINDAYGVLGDDSKRRQYDQSLSQPSYSPGSSPLRPHAQGPHRSWGRSPPRRSPGPATSGAQYNPFGRRTPNYNNQSSTSNASSTAYARAAPDPFGRSGVGRRKGGIKDGNEDDGMKGESGLWRFGVVVGLIMAVVSFGGGLTASADIGESEQEGSDHVEGE